MRKNYIKAFKQFSQANDGEFQVHKESWGTYFLWKGVTYIVKHESDLKRKLTEIFKLNSYNEINLELTDNFWYYLLDYVDLTRSELITGTYNEWRKYWQKQKTPKRVYLGLNEEKNESFQALTILNQALIAGADNPIRVAVEIDDMILLPCIAMTIKSHFEDADDFVDSCLSIITDCGADLLSYGDTFEVVNLNDDEAAYFIYNDLLEFEDLLATREEKTTKG